MSGDIESRLRNVHAESVQLTVGSNILLLAADEIAALRARVDELTSAKQFAEGAAETWKGYTEAAESKLEKASSRIAELEAALSHKAGMKP